MEAFRDHASPSPSLLHLCILSAVCSILSKVLRGNKTDIRYGFERDDPSVSFVYGCCPHRFETWLRWFRAQDFVPCLTPPSSLRHQPSHAIVLRSGFPLRLGGGKKVSFGVRANCWSWHRWHSASSTHGAASGAASPSSRQRDPTSRLLPAGPMVDPMPLIGGDPALLAAYPNNTAPLPGPINLCRDAAACPVRAKRMLCISNAFTAIPPSHHPPMTVAKESGGCPH